MKLPIEIGYAIALLNREGFEAFAVGGCVRDSLLSKIPQDWDIATSARPDQIKNCFAANRTIDTGIKHGTVTVQLDSVKAEITTYRVDGQYSDGRHPDTVEFTESLKRDLSRRDFTVNAMAYHHESGVVDYFGGTDDLKNHVIKCVGDAETRFSEDALRILRAVRFSSQLGFHIDTKTRQAMEKLSASLGKISPERVFSELCKTLKGDSVSTALMENVKILSAIISEISAMQDFCQHSKYHDLDVLAHTAKALGNSRDDLVVRLAVLFHDIGKPSTFSMHGNEGHFYGHATKSAEIAERTLLMLRCCNEIKNSVVYLVKHHQDEIQPDISAVKRLLGKTGEGTFRQLILLKRADSSALREVFAEKARIRLNKIEAILDDVIRGNEAFSLRQLCVNGDDLIAIGFSPDKTLGQTLDILLDGVISGRLTNKRRVLIKEAEKYLSP